MFDEEGEILGDSGEQLPCCEYDFKSDGWPIEDAIEDQNSFVDDLEDEELYNLSTWYRRNQNVI